MSLFGILLKKPAMRLNGDGVIDQPSRVMYISIYRSKDALIMHTFRQVHSLSQFQAVSFNYTSAWQRYIRKYLSDCAKYKSLSHRS